MKCGTLIGSVDGLYQVVSDTTITAASNIMTNPGFETGNVSPWQRTNGFATNLTVSATRHSGNHGGNCTFGESSPQYVYQDLIAYKSAMQGRTCTFKIWMKLSYRTTPAVRIYVRANNAFYLPSALINGDDAWHQYTLSFVGNFDVGGTTTYIQVGVLSSVDNVYPVYIDDAELIISPGVTQIQASGLSGDIDNHYKVIGYLVGNGTVDYKLRLNNDSSANYGHQELKITQTPAYTAQRIENDNGVLLGNAATGQACFFEADIYAHTDQERTISVRSMSGVSGAVFGSLRSIAGVYNVLTPEVTSLEILSSPTYGLGLGSRVIVLKKVELVEGTEVGSIDDPADIKGTWTLVERTVIEAETYTHTFAGLSGNDDVIYRVLIYGKAGSLGGPGNTNIIAAPAGGSYAAVNFYYHQGAFYTYNVNNTLSVVGIGSANTTMLSETIIYAAAGFPRIAMSKYQHDYYSHPGFSGGIWSNTANNITSLIVEQELASFGVGTVLELWKLNIG